MRDNTPFPLSLTRSVRDNGLSALSLSLWARDKALLPLSFHRRSKDNLRPSRQLRPSAVPAEPLRREVGSGARPGHPNSRGCPTPWAPQLLGCPNVCGAPTPVAAQLPGQSSPFLSESHVNPHQVLSLGIFWCAPRSRKPNPGIKGHRRNVFCGRVMLPKNRLRFRCAARSHLPSAGMGVKVVYRSVKKVYSAGWRRNGKTVEDEEVMWFGAGGVKDKAVSFY